jgi:hypothetical protein
MDSLKPIQLTFVSYAHEDTEFALRLAKDLRGGGAAVWMDRLDIKPGQRWDRAVEDALAKCPQLLMILSPAAVESTNVMDEVSLALEEGKTVLPVIHRECKIPFRLRRLQYVNLTLDYKAGLDRLLETLDVTAPENAQSSRPLETARAGLERDQSAPSSPEIPEDAVDENLARSSDDDCGAAKVNLLSLTAPLEHPPLPCEDLPAQLEEENQMATPQISHAPPAAVPRSPQPVLGRKSIAVAIVALMSVVGAGWYLGYEKGGDAVTPTTATPPKNETATSAQKGENKPPFTSQSEGDTALDLANQIANDTPPATKTEPKTDQEAMSELQQYMNKQALLATTLSNIANQRHEMMKTVASNLRDGEPPQTLTPFVYNFVESLATNDLDTQLRYYADPVNYCEFGQVTKDVVRKDLKHDITTWPNRTYSMKNPPSVTADGSDFIAEFPMTYTVTNRKGTSSGTLQMRLRLNYRAQTWQIVEIQKK